jgi:hypothetical protein
MKTMKQLKEEFRAYYADLKENAKEEGYQVNRQSEWEFFLAHAKNRE